MLQFMLYTNICIYVMNEHPKGLREKFNRLTGQICISSIALAELRFGAEKSARRTENLETITQFVSRLDVLPFDEKAAAHYGEIRAALVRSGKPAGPHDMLIGAHARAENLIVVTNNIREFERMPGVRTENWI